MLLLIKDLIWYAFNHNNYFALKIIPNNFRLQIIKLLEEMEVFYVSFEFCLQKGRMAGSYPCLECKTQCQNDTIQCSDCNKWVHIQCVPMSPAQLKVWSQSHLSFLCRNCCCNHNGFDPVKSLKRYLYFEYFFVLPLIRFAYID